jgi:PAS domain S-box-containing protein
LDHPDVRNPPPSSLLVTDGSVNPPHAKILKSLPEVIFATDADGAWTYLNPAWTKLTGFTVARSLGRRFLDFIWADDRDQSEAQFARLVSGEWSCSRHEVRYCTTSGSHRWVEVTASLDHDPDDRLLGTYGSIIDITDRKQAEFALQQRERELQEAQRIARTGHWRLCLSTGECEWSAGVYHLMRMSPEEYRPTLDDLLRRIHEDDREETARRLAECVGTRSEMEWQYRIRDRCGRELILQAEGRCEFDDNGTVAAVFGICRDVTTDWEAKATLKAAKEAAEAANQAKSKFLASTCHELRTPLNAIIGFSEVMKEQILGPLADRYRDYAEDIHCSGMHLLDLINDLLDTAKIEAGQLEYHEEPISLREIIGEAIRLTRLSESDAQHTLDLDVPEPLPALFGDRRGLKQVLINLLGNAVKFTPEGGRIGVAVSTADGSLEIVVRDTGVGIPKDRIADLCQPFKRIENVLSCRHQGSGMGLFITKALVERHGGTLVIESGLGEGTTVRVRLQAMPTTNA